MISDWIYEENLKPLLETVSHFVGYSFDESDWIAVNTGVLGTDDEKDKWYEYQLIGSQTVEVKIADDPGSSVLIIKFQREPAVEEKIQIATSIFQNYRLA